MSHWWSKQSTEWNISFSLFGFTIDFIGLEFNFLRILNNFLWILIFFLFFHLWLLPSILIFPVGWVVLSSTFSITRQVYTMTSLWDYLLLKKILGYISFFFIFQIFLHKKQKFLMKHLMHSRWRFVVAMRITEDFKMEPGNKMNTAILPIHSN